MIEMGRGMIFPDSYNREHPDYYAEPCPCEDGEPCAYHDRLAEDAAEREYIARQWDAFWTRLAEEDEAAVIAHRALLDALDAPF